MRILNILLFPLQLLKNFLAIFFKNDQIESQKLYIKKRIDKWKIDKLSNNTNMEFIHQSEINKLSF